MTSPDRTPPGPRLQAALDGLAAAFRGMTAAPDEHNCECHWGSANELALLKTADVPLDPDLLRRTWWAPGWSDHASVVRRILPQFAAALVDGAVEPKIGFEDAGRFLAHGEWRQWSSGQSSAVQWFLDAWWAHTLTAPDPAIPAFEVFAFLAEASDTLTPWLTAWEMSRTPAADRHLAEAIEKWEYDLLGDVLPWCSWGSEASARAELVVWLIREAPGRLRGHDALLQRVRLLGLNGPARWDDPHWPGHTY
ncbi:hypothetical protein [Actinomadura violacea]|uniref:DUF4253 domain-containing protein n=1 Tax=Actinomadura violacea TaxID=2819934 RepID=A0ABS3S7E8_9ACTN|nr:hypothetical protein [Actinomadura violacea]MBO2464915.1 hypothetical protein [Actinomadura violacea]